MKKTGTYTLVGTVNGTSLKASVKVVVKAAPVVKKPAPTPAPIVKAPVAATIDAVTVSTTEGNDASLPTWVRVTYTDKSVHHVPVTWDTVDTSKAGTYTVTGAVKGTNIAAKATVVVKAAAKQDATITSVASVNDVAVAEGSQPTLPTTVTVSLSDGTTKDVAVNWDTKSLDVNKVGTTTLTGTIEGTDKTASVKVVVSDKTAPVITLNGDATVNLANGTAYTEAGATVTDNNDQNLTATPVITDAAGNVVASIDGKTAGTYTVTYTAKDAAGNEATPVQRKVVVAASQALAVSSVTAQNVKQVAVVFNNAVDSTTAQNTSNYTIGGATVSSAVLQSDGKTVILNISSTGLTNFQKYTITVSNVKDTNGSALAASINNFTVNDTAIPTVTSVQAKGNKTIVINFSAPVTNADYSTGTPAVYRNILVDGNAVAGSAATASLSADGTQLTIIYNGALTTGNHTVAIAQTGDSHDIQSYTGFNVPSVSNTIAVTADTTAPTVQSVNANSQTSVTVKFSKPVNVNTGSDQTKFYWNTSNSYSDNSNVPDTITKVDDQTYTLSFNNKPLPAGTVSFFVNGVKDYSGNAVAGNVTGQTNILSQQIQVAANAQPTVASVTSKGNNTIFVNYSAAMDPTSARNTANYTVKASDGTIINVTNAAWVSGTTDQKQIQLTTSAMTSGTYTVQVNNVKDTVGNVLNSPSNTVSVADNSAPQLLASPNGVSFQGQSIVVNFNRAMSVTGANSVLNPANYQYQPNGGTEGNLPAGTVITAFNGNKSVQITVPNTTTLNSGDQLFIGYLSGTTLNTVADANGNLYNPDSTGHALGTAKLPVDITSNVATSPTLKIVDASTLKLTLDSSVNNLETVNASDFKISTDAGSTTFAPASVSLDPKDTTNHTLLFTLPSGKTLSPSLAGVAGQIQVGTVASPTSTDIYGTKIVGGVTISNATATNSIAPTLVSAILKDPTHVDVKFSGDLSAQVAGNLENSIQIVQGNKVLTGYDSNPAQGKIKGVAQTGNNVVEFTLSSLDALDPSQPVTVRTVSADFMTAKDASGNLLASNTTGVQVNTFATSAVNVSIAGGAFAANDTLGLTFNRNIDFNSIVQGWDGTGSKTATLTFNSDGTASISGANVGTFSGFTVPTSGNVPVTLTSTGSNNLTITLGAVGNTVATANGVVNFTPSSTVQSSTGITAGSYPVPTTSPVDAKPFILGAVASNGTGTANTVDAGDKVTITFSEATNHPALAAGSTAGSGLDAVLPIGSSKTWGTNASAAWSNGNKTLTITVGTGATVASTDTLNVDGSTIKDADGANVVPTGAVTVTGAY